MPESMIQMLFGSAVIAALISGGVALIGHRINSRLAREQLARQAAEHEEQMDLELQKMREELARPLGGAVAEAEIERTVAAMFEGRNARSFDMIKSTIRGIDDDALRRKLIAMGMEAYQGPKSNKEFWRYRR